MMKNREEEIPEGKSDRNDEEEGVRERERDVRALRTDVPPTTHIPSVTERLTFVTTLDVTVYLHVVLL